MFALKAPTSSDTHRLRSDRIINGDLVHTLGKCRMTGSAPRCRQVQTFLGSA